MVRLVFVIVLLLVARPGLAAEVVILGEVHDNPAHHRRQADEVARLAPAALVFEMLTAEQAARITPALRGDADELAAALDWDASGWPDFSLYYPIIAAAPQAVVVGAGVPRGAARAAMELGVAESFGPDAQAYGLTAPLGADEQARREADQFEAHCEALPEEMLPVMVELQRLRDAMLARAVVAALDEYGAPVVLITGNGHARRDRGAPVALALVRPGLDLRVVGQGEDGEGPQGLFDEVWDAPAVDRPDPCDVFR